jgi:large-conductance mechanosensitive channel
VANSFNAAKVNLCGVYSGTTFNFNQAALTTALTSCVNEIIVSVFTTNSVLNQLWQQTDQKLYSEQSGFDSIFKWLIVLAAIIGAVIIIGFIIFLIIDARKPKQPSPQNIPMMAMQPTGLTSTRTSTRIPI